MEGRLTVLLAVLLCNLSDLGYTQECLEGFGDVKAASHEELRVNRGLYVFPYMAFECDGKITGWTYRLADLNTTQEILEKIELWTIRDGGFARRKPLSRTSSKGKHYVHDYKSGFISHTLSHPIRVTASDILAVDSTQRASLAYGLSESFIGAFYMEDYTKSFNTEEARNVAVMPLIIPTFSAVRRRLPRQIEDMMMQNGTENGTMHDIFYIALGSAIPGGILMTVVLICVLSCCCKMKCAQHNSTEQNSSDYLPFETGVVSRKNQSFQRFKEEDERIARLPDPVLPTMPQADPLPDISDKTQRKMPLMPPKHTHKAHTFERMQPKSYVSDDGGRATQRPISSPEMGHENPLNKHEDNVLIYENFPQADAIEDENYTLPAFHPDTIQLSKNIAYKGKSSIGQQEMCLNTPSDDAYTDKESNSDVNPNVQHSYDKPHAFWI